MVVDDDPENNLSLKVGLEELDQSFEVICAESGSQLFKFLNEKEIPDLVLLDIMMPNISGWEVFGKLKKNPEWQKIPVIFLTARSDQMAKNAGESPDLIVAQVLASEKNVGWDFRERKITDLIGSGIIDPVKVTRIALENAASCAGTLITTNYGIIQTG